MDEEDSDALRGPFVHQDAGALSGSHVHGLPVPAKEANARGNMAGRALILRDCIGAFI